ncbi:hypothetical protein NA56DRAFT_708266 [Hyaloscypha hepaticicola]|uniref:Uncharacterized protein n=1 Tax=Hyaloscypha hepaticicola TaxID=2082293 RepID=A0A2J6PSN8_9HELO|nr:hypothetical protein NA56DRAFT_708266 [Hyaloscypha hepaticicola]
MPPKKNKSNPGGKVTKCVFSGPGRRLGDGKEILKSNKREKTEDSDDDYNDYQEGRDVAKGKKRKVEDSDDDDDYHEGEARERHDLSHEAPKLYPKTQTRSGLRRGFYKYGEGRVLAESSLSYRNREQRFEPTPPQPYRCLMTVVNRAVQRCPAKMILCGDIDPFLE